MQGIKIHDSDKKDTTKVVLNKVLMDSLKKINTNARNQCVEDAFNICLRD